MLAKSAAFTLSIGLALAFATPKAAHATGVGCDPIVGGVLTCSWADLAIVPFDDPDVDPNFTPEGTATFELLAADSLQITLTYTGFDGITADPLTGIPAQWSTLSGLIWDIDGAAISGVAQSALINSGSALVGVNSGDATSQLGNNLAGEWAYKENIDAGDAPLGTLGAFGLGAVGDINGGDMDTFGVKDIIDQAAALAFYGNAPNGSAFTLVPDGYLWPCSDPNCTANLFSGGFQNHGPYVQNSMVFVIDYDRALTLAEISNVQPIFGTEGAPLVPEPSSLVLFAAGSAVVAFAVRRRRLPEAQG